MKNVFINGEAGTTGLKIYNRLSSRKDLNLISLPNDKRKDPASIKKALDSADVAFLCLPDAAAIEAVSMSENPDTVIIDTSTAHRTSPGWVYGFPELSKENFAAIKKAKRIAVPGCHSSGFIALVYPLIEAGVLSASALLTCQSITGYSGGGKPMIAEYEDGSRSESLSSPRIYAITQQHKHLKEMKAITRLERAPHFTPIVADYFSGMLVSLPIFSDMIVGDIQTIKEIYKSKYSGSFVRYCDNIDEGGFIASNELSGKDYMKIAAAGNDERITLYAQFDNLGKGASGAAVQCMNIALGLAPEMGLVI